MFALQTLAGNWSRSQLPADAADIISRKPAVGFGRGSILQEESVCVSGARKEELLSVRSESRGRGDQPASVFVVFIAAPGRFYKVLQDTSASFHQLHDGSPVPAPVPGHRLVPL